MVAETLSRGTYDVKLDGSELSLVGDQKAATGQVFQVEFDCSNQHTITWRAPLCARGEPSLVLPAATCNLYRYPSIELADGSGGRTANAQETELLVQLLLLLAADAGKKKEITPMFDAPDKVGAFPIHALLVGNSEASLDATWRLMEANPTLLEQVHTTASFGLALFNGESSLHVAAVNKHEELLLKMLDLGERTLSSDAFKTLLNHQTRGVFFKDPPMNWYGSTALAYAATFGLKKAVTRMLATKHVALDENPCEQTGYYPIHAVVANRRTEMYDFLVTELAADPKLQLAKTAKHGPLTALQLAATLGNRITFKHVLRQQCTLQWKWGPCAEYAVNLDGIDSAGEGGGDVMEMIGKMDAGHGTHELLLDSFMNGFINDLYRQKWNQFGWKLHAVRLLFELIAFGITTVLAFGFKQDAVTWHENKPFPIVIMCMSLISIGHEVGGAYLYYQNERGDKSNTTTKAAFSSTLTWMLGQRMDVELFGHFLLLVACSIILSGVIDLSNLEPTSNVEAARRVLKSGSSPNDDDALFDPEAVFANGSIQHHHGLNALWPLLSLGSVCRMMSVTRLAYTPYESLNIFVLAVGKILVDDIFKFLALFANFIFAFYCALYFVYPTADGFEPVGLAPDFNEWHGALITTMQLAFLGAEFEFDLGSVVEADNLSGWQFLDLWIFLVLYLIFILMSIILLLNLLIAMLSFSFEGVREESTLKCRLSFSRYILRLERYAELIGLEIKVGTLDESTGKRVSVFRSVEGASKIIEDGVVVDAAEGGQSDPFRDNNPYTLDEVEPELAKIQQNQALMDEKINKIMRVMSTCFPEEAAKAASPPTATSRRTSEAPPSSTTEGHASKKGSGALEDIKVTLSAV